MNEAHILFEWTAPEKPPHTRGKRWYLIAGTLSTLLLAYALYTQAWTFAVVIVLLMGIYVLIHSRPPVMHTVQISSQGLRWNKRLIPWSDLENFWLLQGPGYVELHVERKKSGGRLIVQTGDRDPLQIGAAMAQFLTPITDRQEKILDYLIRICKL